MYKYILCDLDNTILDSKKVKKLRLSMCLSRKV